MKSHSLTRRLLVGLLLTNVAATASAQMTINGTGATFPYPIYSKWFDAYAKVNPSVRFNYQSIGSGGGQKQILAQTVDFGPSDGPMSDDQINHGIGDDLTAKMADQPDRIPDYLNLLFIARHLERVGDHAKNIAEDAVYTAEAEDIRHPNNLMEVG
jgi:hypothetical protein